MNKWLYKQLTELTSRKWISKMTGTFAQSPASKVLISHFAKVYNINLDEAEKTLSDYHSLNEFFTRRLKPGARPIHPNSLVVTSPVDALITACGAIQNSQLLEVKGQIYSVSDLLQSKEEAARFNGGFFYVLYLSPTDYHRIHTPVSGKVRARKHLVGKVYPVNNASMTLMSQVLNRNERLITYLETEQNQQVAIVKVGALNVSSINYVNEHHTTFNKGDELAFFAFGSTVVLLFEADSYIPIHPQQLNTRIKMGEQLGTLKQS